MTHAHPCITVALRDFTDCPHTATIGQVCDRCYDRIDHAIQRAAHLRTALAGIDHAITAETSSTIAGPRIPLTAIRIALDEIDSYQRHRTDTTTWVATHDGAVDAVRFARAVHRTERAHPTVAAVRKLHRLRCPDCRRLTAIVRPPDWYGDTTTITCIACHWEATNPDALDIVTAIEAQGPIDLIALATRHRKGAA